METKVLRSAIETYPIVICIPTDDSTLLSNKARIFVCSNRLFVINMAGVEQGSVSNEEFMKEVARYECVYDRNSKEFKDRNKKANCWVKIGEKFNLSAAEAEVKFRNIRTACGRYLKRLKTLPRFWIGARCSAKRLSKSGMAQSTYFTQTIKHKFDVKNKLTCINI